jgi:hypothetical protein
LRHSSARGRETPTLSQDSFTAKGVDLKTFKTFKMLPVRVFTNTGIIEDDPTYGTHIGSSVRKELTAKGMKEVTENADLEVSAGGLGRASAQLEALIFAFTADAYWGTMPIASIGRYNKEATVFVNLIDPKTKKSVWFGVASRAWTNPSNANGSIERAASGMFKKYPQVP